MTTPIPLHCLVLDGVNASLGFPSHEVLDVEDVMLDLCGQGATDLTAQRAAVREVIRRATTKLSIGERAVVRANGLDRLARQSLAREAHHLGLPALWLVGPDDRELARGDGLAEVIRCSPTSPPTPILAGHSLADLRSRYAGVTVVGDVHGAHQSMVAALAWARSRRHFVILLGDVLDGGVGSLDAVEEAWRLVTRGEAAMLMGNHERKIARWLDMHEGGPSVKLSDGNRITTQALSRLGADARRRWTVRFRGLVRRASPLLQLGDVVLAHGATHPLWWDTGVLSEPVTRYAMFGEVDGSVVAPKFRQGYRWVDAVPSGKTVIVGHDTRSTEMPMVVRGAKDGKVVFLDTGAGKGGVLSSADLRFGADGLLHLENLNVH